MDEKIIEMQRGKVETTFPKAYIEEELEENTWESTPHTRAGERPSLEPTTLDQRIDLNLPRKDWTLYREGDRPKERDQTPHNYKMGNRRLNSKVANEGHHSSISSSNTKSGGMGSSISSGEPGGDSEDDPSDGSEDSDKEHSGDEHRDMGDSGEETDLNEDKRNRKGEPHGRRDPRGRRGPQGYLGPQGPREYQGPPGPTGRDGLVPRGVNANTTLDTCGLEKSFTEYGRAMQDAIVGQNQINMSIADQLQILIDPQNKHVQTIKSLVNENKKRGYDRLFRYIPVFDGTDPTMFDGWIDKLEMACSISGRDIRLEAICYLSGPVRQILLIIPDKATWEDIKAELRRNFSDKKTRAYATILLCDYRAQKMGGNLKNYIDSYSKLLMESSEKDSFQKV